MPQCFLCSKEIAPAIARFQTKLQPIILHTLRANFPTWSESATICPECVQQVLTHAKNEEKKRGIASLQYDLGLPFPVRSRTQAYILPTPYRTQADQRFSGRGVTIAFLDSGFSPHPDLAVPENRIRCYADATGARVVVRREFDPPEADSWHGTMTCAVGVGSGKMSDSIYRGLASDSDIVMIKTGYRRGRGALRISEADILRALTWALDNAKKYHTKVINISLGGDMPCDGTPTPLDEIIDEAAAQGITVVCASGNGGYERIVPPASADAAITVGGLDDQNSTDYNLFGMYRSNYGSCGGTRKPDLIARAIWVAAPMVMDTPTHTHSQFLWDLHEADDRALISLLKENYAQARFNKDIVNEPPDSIRRAIRIRMNEDKLIHRHYQHVDGTSMAAPIVSATVAQMLEANPKLTPKQIKKILCDTATPLDGVPHSQQGHGVVQPSAAIAMALRYQSAKLRAHPLSPHHEKHHGVTFALADKSAKSVAIIGSFNDWNPTAEPMKQTDKGFWQGVMQLQDGTHRYKFLLDGEQWMHDPENGAVVEDGFGGYNSLLEIKS